MQFQPPSLPFLIHSPRTSGPGKLVPVVFASPHSGRYYPPDFVARTRLPEHALCQSEDAFVDELFDQVPNFGASLLAATYARAYLDLNRGANELDPDMFTPKLADSTLHTSQKAKAGLGLIPGIIAEGMPIYRGPLPAREAAKRRDLVHKPYHQKLTGLLEESRIRFGAALLLDCHSMPSEDAHSDKAGRRGKRSHQKGVDIVLGDSWGSSCDREITSMAEEFFISAGFRVRRNLPYSGGFSTVQYGKPAQRMNALQIEIARGLYMNEASRTPLPEFEEIKRAITRVSEQLTLAATGHLANLGEDRPRAAE